jgi:hypothetical protein
MISMNGAFGERAVPLFAAAHFQISRIASP